MDTSDPEITFNEAGECNHCQAFKGQLPNLLSHLGDGSVERLVSELKTKNRNKKYDCVVGVSGGVDSSYLIHKAVKEWGLRVLAVHVDAGWNSEVAVSNIQKLMEKLNVKLHTIVINWEEMRDLQLAYLKSGVANQDTPQDHAFFAALYKFAVKSGISDILSGHNWSTESVLPKAWGYNPMDAIQLKDIQHRFGKKKLKKFPIVNLFQMYFVYPFVNKMKVHRPLNYLNYSKDAAMELMQKEYGWKDYGGKHHESRFTRFFQTYYLPEKFHFDKRKAHYSSLILSGQMTREEALRQLEKPSYDMKTIEEDKEYIAKKLGISISEMNSIIDGPSHTHLEFKNQLRILDFLLSVKKAIT